MSALLATMLLASSAFACPTGATCASGWSADRILVGAGNSDHYPAGVAVGTYAPNQDVYFAVDWKDGTSDASSDHQMEG